eukprot:TRINITY_DN1415_c0_g1_i1.p1 TRINITY_DN1415_c0_g1~~TRINITY_DN1415_c0_g1_i1.p1  ORF type:complete len:443 (+),score=127.09 TRINITY_DN1415_c0_g1_i1:52-1329(+)
MGLIASCCAASACSCCVGLSCSACGTVLTIKKSEATRAWYAGIFLLFALIAWVLDVWAYDILHWIPWHVIQDNCPEGSCGTFSVYRIASALSLFHTILALSMIGITDGKDARAQFQDGWWPVKFVFLGVAAVGSFLIPNTVFEVYAWIAVFGAGLFLLIQLVLLIDFAHTWSETWIGKWEEDEEANAAWYYGLVACSIIMYLFAIGLAITMYVLFSEGSSCWYNPLVVTLGLLGLITVTVSSIHPKVHEFNPRVGLLQSSVVSAYVMYVIWSAILSEPTCTGPFSADDSNDWIKWATVVVGAIITIVAVLYASLRAGSSQLVGSEEKSLKAEEGEAPEGQDFDDETSATTYNYSMFHVALALGSMYMAMLLTNWTIIDHSTESIWTDMGWVSVGVKFACAAAAILLYLWTVFAPVLFPDRDFGLE